jgi:hypothetical protein
MIREASGAPALIHCKHHLSYSDSAVISLFIADYLEAASMLISQPQSYEEGSLCLRLVQPYSPTSLSRSFRLTKLSG